MRSSQPMKTATVLRWSDSKEGFKSRAFKEFRHKKNKWGPEGPNSLVTQRNMKFFLSLKNNEHFHHFPAPSPSLSGSAGVLLFACYSGSTGTLSRFPPHHEFCNKEKDAKQVIMIGRQVMLWLSLYRLWSDCYCISHLDWSCEKNVLLLVNRFIQQNTPSKCCNESLKFQYKLSPSPQHFNLMLSNSSKVKSKSIVISSSIKIIYQPQSKNVYFVVHPTQISVEMYVYPKCFGPEQFSQEG